jgi:hypothetical protein
VIKNRAFIAALLAFWLAIGPLAASAFAASQPCESMSASMPADDCCGSGMDAAKCLAACLTISPAMSVVAAQSPAVPATQLPAVKPLSRYATLAGPPDVAPPKSLVS